MNKLYVKNYKGFLEQEFSFKDVNFFVGENSSGKTSILQLINILYSQHFWLNGKLSTPEVDLGYFDEIKSKLTEEKYFRVGIEMGTKDSQTRYLFEFYSNESVPLLKSIKFENKNIAFHVSILKDKLKYVVLENKKDVDFELWVKDVGAKGSPQSIDFKNQNGGIYFVCASIISEINKKHDSITENNLFASFPPFAAGGYLWMAPIRAKAKRIYESYDIDYSPEGDHIPLLLRKILTNKKGVLKYNKLVEMLNKFGVESNLFDEIKIREFHKKQASPFEIDVKYKGVEVKLSNVGYGVSQALPIIIEMFLKTNYKLSIQQPEVHLHPKAQSAFGSAIFESVVDTKNKFYIETHSDFIIDRFRYQLSKNTVNKDFGAQVIFFERTKDCNKATHLLLDKKGSYNSEIPKEFREFFIQEGIMMLDI